MHYVEHLNYRCFRCPPMTEYSGDFQGEWEPIVYQDPELALPSDSVTYLSFWLGAEAENI